MRKTCLITGASGEIGTAVAKNLAEQNFQLILHFNENKPALNKLVEALPENAIRQIIQADLSTAEGIKQFCSKLPSDIYAVVFAGGKSLYGLFQDVTEIELDMMFNVHVKSMWLITKKLLPNMIRENKGKLVVISSIWGKVGASCEVVYSSVKGAQDAFVKALAKEVALSNIQVNGIAPGFIDTKMNQQFSSEERESIFDDIPAGRPGTTAEIAEAVSFLFSEKVNYLQGQVISVDGAWS